MKHLLITITVAILTAGCAFRPAQKTDQNAALNMGLVEHDVVYRTAGDKNLRLNVYLPDEFIGEPPWWTNDGKGKKPTLLYIHGGGWVVGSKDERALNVLPYVYRDWVVISINYRLAKDAKAPAAVDDCLVALEWIYKSWSNLKRFYPNIHLAQLHNHLISHEEELTLAFGNRMNELKTLKNIFDPQGILPPL